MNAPEKSKPSSPLSTIRGKFRSRARWTAEDFDREIQRSLKRISEVWPEGKPLNDKTFWRVRTIEHRIKKAREMNNMFGVRTALREYENLASKGGLDEHKQRH